MKYQLLLSCLTLFAATSPTALYAATLTVEIGNIPDATGTIRVALCTRQEFLLPNCFYHAVVPAKTGSVTVTLPGINSGTYALQTFQDRDGNQKLTRNFFGIPQSPFRNSIWWVFRRRGA